MHDEQRAQALAAERGWVVKPDGDGWFRGRGGNRCGFVEATGKRGAIGRLEEPPGLIDGTAGTQVCADRPGVVFRDLPRHEAAV